MKNIGKVIKQTNFRDGKCYAGNKRKKGVVTGGRGRPPILIFFPL